MKTLEQIIEKEKSRRNENGDFGIKACKESILSSLEIDKKYGHHTSLFTYLEKYVTRANEECNGSCLLGTYQWN